MCHLVFDYVEGKIPPPPAVTVHPDTGQEHPPHPKVKARRLSRSSCSQLLFVEHCSAISLQIFHSFIHERDCP